MGRSPLFCFSSKACDGGTADGDFPRPQEVKASSKKRRWSLGKKIVERRVPSSTVIAEPLPQFIENQNQGLASDSLYSEKAPSTTLNTSIVTTSGPTWQLPSRVPKDLTNTSSVLADPNISKHATVIQTSIRRYLAQNKLQKLKNVVILQAAARRYLVRKQAVGTLRCIQAIIKMQALVRSRQRLDSAVVKPDMELNKTPSAVRKVDSSAFAHHLLKSMPKTKPIYISCDPLRPDSTWNWLERWMTLTSIDQQKIIPNLANLEKDMENDLASFPDSVQDNKLLPCDREAPGIENGKDWSERKPTEISDSMSIQVLEPSDSSSHFELHGNPSIPNYAENSIKGSAQINDALGNDSGKALIASMKSKNLAFSVVQVKFEELISAPRSNNYFDYATGDAVGLTKSAYSQLDSTFKSSVYSKPSNKSSELVIPDEINHGTASDSNGSRNIKEIKDESKLNKVQQHRKAPISLTPVEVAQMEQRPAQKTISSIQIQQEDSDDTPVSKPSPISPIAEVDSPTLGHTYLRVRTFKFDDNIKLRKKTSQPSIKNSPAHSQTEKSAKTERRLHSPGSAKTVCTDYGVGRSSTSSVPSYMQLTESAKAKINTSSFQKSGISFHPNDNYMKKRQSLPVDKLFLSPRLASPFGRDLKGYDTSTHGFTERRWQI